MITLDQINEKLPAAHDLVEGDGYYYVSNALWAKSAVFQGSLEQYSLNHWISLCLGKIVEHEMNLELRKKNAVRYHLFF